MYNVCLLYRFTFFSLVRPNLYGTTIALLYYYKLAIFIKSEMLREVRENCFCKYQRYPIITIESRWESETLTNRLSTTRSLYPLFCAKRGSTTMGSSLCR